MSGRTRPRLRAVIRELIRPVVYPMVLLISAGSLTWVPAWRLFSILAAFRILNWLAVRKSAAPRPLSLPRRAERRDRLLALLTLVLNLALLIVCGLDGGRFHFSQAPVWLTGLGVAIMLPALGLGLWTLLSAPSFRAFLSASARDRSACRLRGPFRLVRHPRVTGLAFSTPARAMILGSVWGLGLAGALVVLLIWQVRRQDAALISRSPAFAQFSRRTGYRLLPLIW